MDKPLLHRYERELCVENLTHRRITFVLPLMFLRSFEWICFYCHATSKEKEHIRLTNLEFEKPLASTKLLLYVHEIIIKKTKNYDLEPMNTNIK